MRCRRWEPASCSAPARRPRISSTTSAHGSPSSRIRKPDAAVTSRLRELSTELHALEDRLRQGGGAEKIEKQHKQGKLTARERVTGLCDPGSRFIELGLLVAYDEYDGQAPAAGI